MDDHQSGPQAMETLLADLIEESAAETKTETPSATVEDEAKTETEDTSQAQEEDSAEDETDEQPEEEEQPKKRGKSGLQRIKAKLEAAEAELAQFRSRAPADSEGIARAVEAEIGAPPKESDFSDYLAFERALTAYAVEQKLVERELKKAAGVQSQLQRERFDEMIEDFQEREAEVRKAIPDYDAVIEKAKGTNVSEDLAKLILESEKGAHLKYHFAKNPDKLEALNALSKTASGMVSAAREIGRLEARLSLPNPKTATKAPPPVSAVKGGAAPSSPDKDLDGWLSKTYGKR